MHHPYLKISLSLCVAVMLLGCATKGDSFGGAVKAEGKAVSVIGEKWEKGQSMIKKGNKLVRKGNEQIADGEENIADGKAMAKTILSSLPYLSITPSRIL